MNILRGLGVITAEMVSIVYSGIVEFNKGFNKGIEQVKAAREAEQKNKKEEPES